MSGLPQALRLKEAGIPFTLVEKNDSVGGTWYENRYPGCRVDIANHFCSYSFGPYAWSEYFSRRDELLAYFRNFVKRHGLEAHIRYNTEMTARTTTRRPPHWDDRPEEQQRWCAAQAARQRHYQRGGTAEPSAHS